MHSLAQRALSQIRREELLHAGDRVGVAVSGGIDSVALLRLLVELRGELGIVLSVVHFNHKLRGAESDLDERFVAELARSFDLEFFCESDDVARHAAEERIGLEAAARELRYGFFHQLIAGGLDSESQDSRVNVPTLSHKTREGWGNRLGLDTIVTGHTLDDQAETVLMRVIRGSGLAGLGGIYPRIAVEDDDGEVCGEIVRPLLAFRRRELEGYLKEIGQGWRDDSSNTDEAFTRNRVRKLLVPLIEKEFNPGVAENLAELAEIARGEEDYWENEVAGWMGTGVHWSEPEWARAENEKPQLVQIAGMIGLGKIPTSAAQNAAEMGHPSIHDLRTRIVSSPWLVMNASVDRLWFLSEPLAVRRRVVKAIGDEAGIPLEFKHVEKIIRMAGEEDAPGKELSLPQGWKFVTRPQEFVFVTPDLRENSGPMDYEYELSVPGRIFVREIGSAFEARRVSGGDEGAYNPEHLLRTDLLSGLLRIRNWRAGDRFWPAHTKSPKKIKELLQERHVAQPERKMWPVVVSGEEVIWMRGFPVPANWQAKPGQDAIVISEVHEVEKEI